MWHVYNLLFSVVLLYILVVLDDTTSPKHMQMIQNIRLWRSWGKRYMFSPFNSFFFICSNMKELYWCLSWNVTIHSKIANMHINFHNKIMCTWPIVIGILWSWMTMGLTFGKLLKLEPIECSLNPWWSFYNNCAKKIVFQH